MDNPGNTTESYQDETKAENSFISTDRVNTREEGEKTRWWAVLISQSWCPSWLFVSQGIMVGIAILMAWGILFCLMEEPAAPGGQLFTIGVLFMVAQVAGWLIHFLHLPPLLGMLIAGIVLRNIGFINISGGYVRLTAVLRQVALVIILIRAGLELDPAALRKLKGMVFRLAVVPSVVEIASIAVLTHYLLNFPWIWGFLLGSVLAAVSPAVVIPCLFSLAARGYGTDKGIPTLIVAAASFDDIIAISVFGILISIIFSTGSLTVQIIRGPAGLILGLVFGILWGLMARHIPAHSHPWVVGSRTILIGGGGLMAVLGSEVISFDGAGPLGCIVAAFVASCGWRSQGWSEEHNPVAENFALIWTFFQPILFSLIGTEINIFVLEVHTVGLGLVCLLLALLVKMLLSIMAAMGGGLSWKEKLFVSMAWFPKATVQAALGPIALDLARNLDAKDNIVLADKVLIVAVLAIMITAPLGAIVITLFGPRLLNKTPTSLP